MTQINLSQALRNQKRIKEMIAKLSKSISEYNSILEGGSREIDIHKAIELRDFLKKRLVAVKMILQDASRPIQQQILEVSELKDQISFYQKLNVKHGKALTEGFHPQEVSYNAIIRKIDVEKKCARIQHEMDGIYSRIDEFNNTHFVELEEVPFEMIDSVSIKKTEL
ncbi:MAG: hypothetical protein LBQ66_12110 [Planctomycetaceae bacterium]|jgi:hypothetical protein|nr:hypothetical protein [Planctomycetaceae bacterium]